jgi:hypothetical protein
MAKKNIYLKISIIALVFGLMAVGSIGAQTDNRLNGTWSIYEDGTELEYRFANGSYEIIISGMMMERGNYTTDNNNVLNLNPTHIHGAFGSLLVEILGIKSSAYEAKWYTINEFIAVLVSVLSEIGINESQINEIISELVSAESMIYPYSIDENTLIITKPEDKSDIILIKK